MANFLDIVRYRDNVGHMQAERLREWRIGLGLTQEGAAKRLGVSQASWCDWENGKKTPQLPHALRLAKITQIPIEELAGDGSEEATNAT